MIIKHYVLTFFILIAAMPTLEAKVYYFDFGTKTSPVMDGFTGINPESKYSATNGYGFITKNKPRAFDRKLPEPVSQDFISNGWFRVDLPDGDYKVWIMYGDSHHGQRIWPIIKNMKVKADGKTIFEQNLTQDDFYKSRYFAHLNADYRKGDDIWDKYINVKFRKHIVPIKVKGGKVNLAFYKIPVNALAIYPVKDAEEVEDELRYLEKRRKRKVSINEVKHIEKNPVPVPSARDKQQGFILFSRPWADRIYPSTRPLASEINQPVKIFASPDENQAGSFSLYPLKDLNDVGFTVSDLKTRDGKTFSKDNIELRIMRYFETYVGQRGSAEYKFQVKPLILYKSEKINLQLGVTKQIFLNVQVPENTALGIYDGKIHITSKSGIPAELTLKLRVLPIKLEPVPILYGFYHFNYDYYYYRYWSKIWTDEEMEKRVWENEEKDLKFLKKVGFNSLALSDDLRGDITSADGKGTNLTFDFNGRFGKWMDLYTKLGFGPMPWYGFSPQGSGPSGKNRLTYFAKVKGKQFSDNWNKAYVKLIELVRDEVKKRKWSDIYIYVSDELGNYGIKGAEHGVKLLNIVKKIKGIRWGSSMNGPDEQIELPHLDIAMPNFAFPVTEKRLKMIRDNKCELWLYNMGFSRFGFGFYPWRTGAKGRYQWFHRSSVVNPYDDFDGNKGGDGRYNMTFPSPDGPPRGTIKLEQMRAGINDMRYIATLEKRMQQLKNSKNPVIIKELANARQLLEELKNEISVDMRDYHLSKVDAKEAGGHIKKWNSNLCDKYRWKIAEQIMRLDKGE